MFGEVKNMNTIFAKRDEDAVEHVISRAQLLVITRNINTIKETKQYIERTIKNFNMSNRKYLVEQLILLEKNPNSVYMRAVKNKDVADILSSFVLADSKCSKLYGKLKAQESAKKRKKMGLIQTFVFLNEAREMLLKLSNMKFIKKQNYDASIEDMLVAQSRNMQYLTQAKRFYDYILDVDQKTINSLFKECAQYDKNHGTNLLSLAKSLIAEQEEIMSFMSDVRKNCIAVDECVPNC